MFKSIYIFFIALLPSLGFTQGLVEFSNYGAVVYTQKGAVITVQGTFVNGTDTSGGIVYNDGTIEVTGNLVNKGASVFTTYTDSTSTDRAVKFIGDSTQIIIGNMNTPGTASFYNLVVDQASPTDTVSLDTSIAITGSLVFGTNTTTTTYNPSSTGTDYNNKGLITTYSGNGEYVLSVQNGDADAIAGYAPMTINGNPSNAYILTSGIRGSANGGLQRQISSATAYNFPIGTNGHGFNGVRLTFDSIPSGGGLVTGKFNDGSDNPTGSVGYLSQLCIGCTANYPSPNNSGYNQYFTVNPCNDNNPQWVILNDAILNHGYWSFESAGNDQSYKYFIETFPNTYTALGSMSDDWRTLKYGASYGTNPSGASVNWTPAIDSIASTNELLTYTLNTGNCYTGSGVPGGSYTGFGHFTMKMGEDGAALPVTLVALNAQPQASDINVTWTTDIEINNQGFNVERSTDGMNFTNIGWVEGHDNSTVQNNYSLLDENVVPNTLYYYRLNQVDNNGNHTLSQIVSAMVTGATSFYISDPIPNPAYANSTIHISSGVSQTVNVRLVNMIGQVLTERSINVESGNSDISFNVQNLATGTYSAVLTVGEKSFSKLIIVSR